MKIIGGLKTRMTIKSDSNFTCQFEEKVFNYFDSKGVLEKLQKKKKLFRETKETDVDNLLREYYLESAKTGAKSAKIDAKSAQTGAILFLVVEGLVKRSLNDEVIKFIGGFAR